MIDMTEDFDLWERAEIAREQGHDHLAKQYKQLREEAKNRRNEREKR